MKKCPLCHENKEFTQFYAKDSRCKTCCSSVAKQKYQDDKEQITKSRATNIAKIKDVRKRYYTKNKEQINSRNLQYYYDNKESVTAQKREAWLKSLYGLTAEQHQLMLDAQNGLCAICKQPPRGKRNKLHVDHCHETGTVRGLLCFQCNAALGLLSDSIPNLEKAIVYLARAK